MAIFYEHIKGCGPNNNYTSWIKWSNQNSAPSNTDATYLPKIIVDSQDFGNIITSNAKNQQILNGITIHEWVNLEYAQGEQIKIGFALGNLNLTDAKKITLNATNSINFTTPLFTAQGIEVNSIKVNSIEATNKLETPTANITNKLTAGEIESTGKCQASYFNATSDARAKINIIPAHFSALEVVNSIPTYTFNYINKPQERVLGLIAQEAAQHTLDGFNMVDNLTASGEDGDYMQIKESKLVYVLWKAVQELTDEVKSLKAQLNNLK